MIKLLALLGAGIPAIITGLIAMIGRKWGVVTATWAMFAAITVMFVACINTILQSVLNVLTLPSILQYLGWFIPSNWTLCLGAIVSAKICSAARDLAWSKVKTFASAG